MEIVGIFGGTFDPITRDHIRIANYLIEHGHCNEVILMPNWITYGKNAMPYDYRIEMCKIASVGYSYISVSNFEQRFFNSIVKNKENVETYDILKPFIEMTSYTGYRQTKFICGKDVADDILNWKKGKELIDLLPHIIINTTSKTEMLQWYSHVPHEVIKLDTIAGLRSTKVRNILQIDQNTKTLMAAVDINVLNYIYQNRLYEME